MVRTELNRYKQILQTRQAELAQVLRSLGSASIYLPPERPILRSFSVTSRVSPAEKILKC